MIETIQLAGEMIRPMGAVATPDGRQMLISTGRGRSLAIIDTASNTATGAVEDGERPWGVAVSQDGRIAFTANGPSNDVSFVDVPSRTVIAKVKVGDRPWGLVLSMASDR